MTQSTARSSLLSRLRRLWPPAPADVPAPPVPRWVAVADALAVLSVLLALRVLATHGVRIQFAGQFKLSMNSWLRPLAFAAGLLLVRHWRYPARPLPRRLLDTLTGAWRDPAMRASWAPFIVSRLGVLLIGYIAVMTFGFESPAPWRIARNEFLNLPARWDSGWYLSIVFQGYQWDGNALHASSFAFFPGFPILIYAASALTGLGEPAAGFVVVTAAFLWALTYFHRLASEYLPPAAAQAAMLFAVFYPFAVFYSAIYTESLLLLAVLGAFYHFRRGELWRYAGFAVLAGLVRPNGFLLSVPLGLMVLIEFARQRGWLRGQPAACAAPSWSVLARRIGVAALPIVGLLAYSAYVYTRTGDPFTWMKAQQAWGRSANGLMRMMGDRQDVITNYGVYDYTKNAAVEIMEGAAVLLALIGLWPITRRFGLPYAAFVLLCVVPPLYSLGTISLGRYTSPLFPIFLWLGAAVPERRRPYWLAAFAAGQALVAALFFTWRGPY